MDHLPGSKLMFEETIGEEEYLKAQPKKERKNDTICA